MDRPNGIAIIGYAPTRFDITTKKLMKKLIKLVAHVGKFMPLGRRPENTTEKLNQLATLLQAENRLLRLTEP